MKKAIQQQVKINSNLLNDVTELDERIFRLVDDLNRVLKQMSDTNKAQHADFDKRLRALELNVKEIGEDVFRLSK